MSLDEQIQSFILKVLGENYKPDDPITQCGSAALSIIRARPDDVLQLAHERLHSFPYQNVPESWRRLYTDASLWKAAKLPYNDDWVSEIVKLLDMAIIMTGAPRRRDDIQTLLRILQDELASAGGDPNSGKGSTVKVEVHSQANAAIKRRKTYHPIPLEFPTAPSQHIELKYPLPRVRTISLPAFERRVRDDHHKNKNQGPLPLMITDAVSHWPAFFDSDRSWANPQNLLHRTLGGRRLVPVELGRSYTDNDWGQKITTFGEFLQEHMLQDPSTPGHKRKTGYLAQHDLFVQIPELRADIAIPDYCYSQLPGSQIGVASEAADVEYEDDLDREVMLNAWFGPAHTISPLHTDPHHNILAQIVGSKYVRLYDPKQTPKLYPRNREGEVDMSNTSQIDIDLMMRVLEGQSFESLSEGENKEQHDRMRKELKECFPLFSKAEYVEGILGPGECLFIPRGWWHYIRSLSTSCSVSFWWD